MSLGRRDLLNFVRPSEDSELASWTSDSNVKRVDDVRKYDAKGKDVKAFYENLVVETCESKVNPEDVVASANSRKILASDHKPRTSSVHSNRRKKKGTKFEVKHEKLFSEDQSFALQNELFKHSQNGDIQNVSRLVELGVDIHSQDPFGWTALMTASCSGHKDIVLYLLQKGADISIADKKGRDAKSLAKKNNHTTISELLRSNHVLRSDELQSMSSDTSFPSYKSVEYTCDICKNTFRESEKKHLTSTLHLFNLKLKAKRTHFVIPESNRGFQIMMKRGWDGDKGLGSDGQGRKFPVQTVLKRDRQGLGSYEETKVKPKVTHFSAGDTAAVKKPKVERTMKTATLSKRLRAKKESKEKRWERNLRTYMNTE